MAQSSDLTIADVCFNTIKCGIGLGLLYLPESLSTVGYIGSLVVLTFGIVCSTSLYLSSRTTISIDKYEYPEIADFLSGKICKGITTIVLVLFITGGCLVYTGFAQLYLKSTLLLFQMKDRYISELGIAISVSIILTLICSIKKQTIIAKISALGFIGIFYVFIVLIANIIVDSENIHKREKEWSTDLTFSSIAGISLVSGFAYSNNFAFMSSTKYLQNPSSKRQNMVIIICGIIETSIYISFACLGYYIFGSDIFLQNPDKNDIISIGMDSEYSKLRMKIAYDVGGVAMFTVCLCTLPIFILQIRLAILSVFYTFGCYIEWKNILHYVITTIICWSLVFASWLIGLDKINSILKYFSGLLGSILFFFLPAIFFFLSESLWKKLAFIDTILFTVCFLFGGFVLSCFIQFVISSE